MWKQFTLSSIVLFMGTAGASASSPSSIQYDSARHSVTNISAETLTYYPASWPRTDDEVATRTTLRSIADVIRYVNGFGRTPVNGPASNENHSPLNAYLYYGLSACDDLARVTHHLFTSLGWHSRIAPLDGHVAMEVFENKKWIYVDPTVGGYSESSLSDIRALPTDQKFEFINVLSGETMWYDKSIYPFSTIDHYSEVAVEITPPGNADSFVLLPNDELVISHGVKYPFTPYRCDDEIEGRSFYVTLSQRRLLAATDISSALAAGQRDAYQDATIDIAREMILFHGINSSIQEFVATPCPIIGITLEFDRVIRVSGRMLIYVTNAETREQLGGSEFTLDDNVQSVSIPFDTLAPRDSSRAVRQIRVVIAFLGSSESDTAALSAPILTILTQITPQAAELFQNDLHSKRRSVSH
jgi:hypothetical protein